MKLIKFQVTPNSSFLSLPKGDMVFGFFASQLFLDENVTLKNYLNEKPKIIFSDFLPNGYLPKPTLPLNFFGIDDSKKKEFRKKSWIKIDELQKGNISKVEEIKFYKTKTVVRNSINRNTFSTDNSGVFAPYGLSEIVFQKDISLYVMFDEKNFNEKTIEQQLVKIGEIGFGKKSSIGKGQFSVKLVENDIKLNIDSNCYLTIAPTILNNDNIEKSYYDVFNKFGKFSNSNTPFKKPALLAQSGAIVKLQQNKHYIGKAINNGYDKVSFVQGYSMVIPLDLRISNGC